MATTSSTAVDRLNDDIMAQLAQLGGKAVSEDEVTFGRGFTLPELYRDNIGGAIDFLINYREEMETPQRFMRNYPYKPWDGAVAVMKAFKKYFGTSVVQKNSFFEPAGYKSIPVSATEELRVPYGSITIPTFKGTLRIQGTPDDDDYQTFVMLIDTPKKFQYHVEGLFKLVDQELKESSIYRGKAIDGAEMPNFLDLSNIDITSIVYSGLTMRQLEANLWTPIKEPDVCRSKGLDPKRAVLLQGPYGTGKTLGAMWTAKLCEKSGRTFIMCNPKDSNAFECLKTAALYQPSCLFIEDIDKLTDTTDKDQMARLLDEFDGFKAKGKDIAIVLTTNKVGEIHKGMLRPGRMDAVIEIGNLDIEGVEKLIRTQFHRYELSEQLNFEKIHQAMHDFTPAFMKEVCQKVKLYAITRAAADQTETDKHTTEDFLAASEEMRVHYDLHTGAADEREKPTLDRSFMDLIVRTLDKSIIRDRRDDDPMFQLEPAGKEKGTT